MIGICDLEAATGKAAQVFAEHEADLNAADGKLGDGDTGSMLKRLSAVLDATDLSGAPDLAEAFRRLVLAASSATGSSLGTLVMTGMMSLARATSGSSAISVAELVPLLDDAIQAMQTRGGAQWGDKTIVDSLVAITTALAAAGVDAAAIPTARMAARAALEDFRNRPNRLGRAGRYGSKSIGLDDPGMLAIALLCDGL